MSDTTSGNPKLRALSIVTLLLLVMGGSFYGWHYFVSQWREQTDNAYVAGNMVAIQAQLEGTVVWIGAEQADYVEAGQVLVRLDDTDALNSLTLAKHELALAVRHVEALTEQVKRFEAEVQRNTVTLSLARDEFTRRQKLVKQGMVSTEEFDAARTRYQQAGSALELVQRQLAEAKIRAQANSTAEHPSVLAAAARVKQAYVDWRKTEIVAPVSGQLARRVVQVGQRVKAGGSLLAIAELDGVWVEANFKENQLRHLHQGQAVEIYSDLYGEEVEYQGVVVGIGAGTGSVFSLLPPQNATGNWIKIVQRVPVRIELASGDLSRYPLPLGSSLTVTVDTHQRDGQKLSRKVASGVTAEAAVYHYQRDGATAMIEQIIHANITAL